MIDKKIVVGVVSFDLVYERVARKIDPPKSLMQPVRPKKGKKGKHKKDWEL